VSVVDVNQVLVHSPAVVYRDLDAEQGGVLLHMETGGYFSVNTVGRDVWGLVDGQRSLGDVAAAIRQKHQDAGDEAVTDVLSFATALVERGLVTVVTDPGRRGT
jgi:hypothetical protein